MTQATSWFVCRGRKRRDGTRRYFGRLKLPGEQTYTRIALGYTDKHVAQQKMTEIVRERERETVGLSVPRSDKEWAQKTLAEQLAAFLVRVKSRGRSPRTVDTYRKTLTALFTRCGWRRFTDVSERSFCEWKTESGLKPKTLNCILGTANTFFSWLEKQAQGLVHPLRKVEKLPNDEAGMYRRALSEDEIRTLLSVAPPSRAWIYLVIIYTGLRRKEMNGLTWADLTLDGSNPCIRLSAKITKNRKQSRLELRRELVEELVKHKPSNIRPSAPVFRGKVPSVASLKKDLAAAGIPFFDEAGRRIDIHGMRTTFGTLLSCSEVAPQFTKEMMRHSDMRLTQRYYNDRDQLPLAEALGKLPSFRLPNPGAQGSTQTSTQEAVAEGYIESLLAEAEEILRSTEVVEGDALRRTEPHPAADSKRIGAARFELATSTSRT
jgi:integrase